MMTTKVLFAAFTGGLLLASRLVVTTDGAHSLSPVDKMFIRTAAQGNLAEIQFSRLPLQRSKNRQIQNVAGKVIQEHTRRQDNLRSRGGST